ncbi:MAG: hypothetical protein GF329_02375 [Candidatus Lokiarchaeota archaeon]|nr:hypothetical protein [Candidatus Lokiarchaeota archaeon]
MSKYKTYLKITNVAAIARRYFVNNFYDGMLTILGSLLGFLTYILTGAPTVESHIIILAGIGTSISMFISGFSGSYLSEKAERRKIQNEIEKAMGRFKEEEGEKLEKNVDVEEIEKAMLREILVDTSPTKKKKMFQKRKKQKVKTLFEKAESFANKIVSLVNGGAPLLGGLVPLFPFFFVREAGLITFIISFLIIIIFIILLGVFLGVISKGSIIKNVLQMILAFIVTFLVTIPLLLFTPSAGP